MTRLPLFRPSCGLVCCVLLLALCLPARAAQPDPFARLFGYQAFPAGPGEFPV
jgi:hypothetical protein